MERFTYTPLDRTKSEIRLLTLEHGDESTIRCHLSHTILDDNAPVEYEAISYAWGSTRTTSGIVVNDKSFSVTENLYAALQALRLKDRDRVVWVDAVCIDQSNDHERGHQVQHMGKIYSKAQVVIIWLGSGEREIDAAMVSLQQLEELDASTSSDENTKTAPDWARSLPLVSFSGIKSLLSESWFKRVWIIQEVANARIARIWYGSQSIEAQTLVMAVPHLQFNPPSCCRAVMDIMPGIPREESWWSECRDLFNLLLRFRDSLATDPRDKIYALLGISSDAQSSNLLRPDYTKSLDQAIYDTSAFLFGQEQAARMTMKQFLDSMVTRNLCTFTMLLSRDTVQNVRTFYKLRGLSRPVSQSMFKAAAANDLCGPEMVKFLREECNGDSVIPAEKPRPPNRREKQSGFVELTSSLRVSKRNLSAAMLEAAASHSTGAWFVQLFRQWASCRSQRIFKVTETIYATGGTVDGAHNPTILTFISDTDLELNEYVLQHAANRGQDAVVIVPRGDYNTVQQNIVWPVWLTGKLRAFFNLTKLGGSASILLPEAWITNRPLKHIDEATALQVTRWNMYPQSMKRTYVWQCCYCAKSRIPYRTPGCPDCGYGRCGHCQVTKVITHTMVAHASRPDLFSSQNIDASSRRIDESTKVI